MHIPNAIDSLFGHGFRHSHHYAGKGGPTVKVTLFEVGDMQTLSDQMSTHAAVHSIFGIDHCNINNLRLHIVQTTQSTEQAENKI